MNTSQTQEGNITLSSDEAMCLASMLSDCQALMEISGHWNDDISQKLNSVKRVLFGRAKIVSEGSLWYIKRTAPLEVSQ